MKSLLFYCITFLLIFTKEGVAHPFYYGYEVVTSVKHSPTAFTEGLVFNLGSELLTESKGIRGHSGVSLYDALTHNKKLEYRNPTSEFAEGITYIETTDSKVILVQLTYRKKLVHFLDPNSLQVIETKRLPGEIKEGWGLTTAIDRNTLVMSDGSGVLYFLRKVDDKKELQLQRTITIHDCTNNIPEVRGLNELEIVPRYITDKHRRHVLGAAPWSSDAKDFGDTNVEEFIWANVIGTWCICVIHPSTGEVVSWIDIEGIDHAFSRFSRVANGIAFRLTDDSIWITGKNWKKTYQIILKNLNKTISARNKCRTPWRVTQSAHRTKQCSEKR